MAKMSYGAKTPRKQGAQIVIRGKTAPVQNHRLQRASPQCCSSTCTPPFTMVSTSRRPCSSMRKTRNSLFQSGHGTVALRRLASRSSRQTAFSHQRQDRLRPFLRHRTLRVSGTSRVGIARTIATSPLSTRTQRSRRTQSHGSSTQGSSRPSPSGGKSRKDGPTQSRARLPFSSGRGKMEQPRYVSSSTSGERQRRRRIARACCLAAPFRPHQQHPRFDGLRQRVCVSDA